MSPSLLDGERAAKLVGKWIATKGGEIVAEGDSLEDVARNAEALGYDIEDIVVEKIAPPGTYIL